MYAVIRTGGKQYRVAEGDTLHIEKLPAEVGAEVKFDEVLFMGNDEEVTIGQPLIEGAKVHAQVLAQEKDKKIVVYKFKRRKNYRRKQGHRQLFTAVKITSIEG